MSRKHRVKIEPNQHMAYTGTLPKDAKPGDDVILVMEDEDPKHYKIGTKEWKELMEGARQLEKESEMQTFTKEQLMSFGNYLFSEERATNIAIGVDKRAENSNMDRFEFIRQREVELAQVSHADFENWKQKTSL